MPQNDILTNNPEIKQYMSTLPAFIQENIHQSGLQVTSKQQLEQCVNHILAKGCSIPCRKKPSAFWADGFLCISPSAEYSCRLH